MLYLSRAIGRPVRDQNGDPTGKVADLIVAVGERYPPVTGIVIATDGRKIFLPVAQESGVDLVVVGCRGRTGLKRIVLGSIARNVLVGSDVSVLVIHQPAEA